MSKKKLEIEKFEDIISREIDDVLSSKKRKQQTTKQRRITQALDDETFKKLKMYCLINNKKQKEAIDEAIAHLVKDIDHLQQ